MSDLITAEEATEAQIDAFVASVRKHAREQVRELVAAGASEVEIAEFVANLESPPADAVSPTEEVR